MHGGHHHHHQGHCSSKSGESKLFIVFILNLLMSIVEFFGGIYTNSTAIMLDALHDFGDSLALGSSWLLERVSNKKSDQKFSFGYKRFSLLSAFLNSLILLVGSLYILMEVFPRLLSPQSVHSQSMIGFAILGLLVNGSAVFLLRGGASYNEKVISLHLLEDVFGWIAVLLGAIAIEFFNMPIIDPILSLVISIFILKNVVVSIKDVLFVLLQGVPQNINLENIKKLLCEHPMIMNVHHVHVWSLDGERHVLTAHVILSSSIKISDFNEIQSWVTNRTKENGLWHSTIQFEIQN